ncbi:MAG TPA: preprotein translocase subunit SecG [Candidatus Bathyarchaeia archaeon]|nr:preprotein translocase subunit SecG [Candidatus Bathyarchaeia archaeon]
MNVFLSAVHIIVSTLLILLIVIQSEGSGLSSTFGGPSSYHSKRGMEKILFGLTVGLAIIFLITSVINFLSA